MRLDILVIVLLLIGQAVLFLMLLDAKRTNARFRRVLDEFARDVEKLDRSLDDPKGDGSGDDPQIPTGDTYNDLHVLVKFYMGAVKIYVKE